MADEIKEIGEQTNILAQTFGEQKQWVNYRLQTLDGKITKVPYAANGQKASTIDPSTWSTYDEAIQVSDKVGIVFTPDQKLLGIDIDHCLRDGEIVHEQKDVIASLIREADTYTEISPSGEGLHALLIVTESLQLLANKKAPFECYTSGRYFTVTGTSFGEPHPIRTVTKEEARRLLAIIGYPWGRAGQDGKAKSSATHSADDMEILKKMFASKNGSAIRALYEGDVTGYSEDDSAADMALCAHLAFWTTKNLGQMERIWLASPLGSREKTQKRKDYRDRTIVAAVVGCKETYGWDRKREEEGSITNHKDVRSYREGAYVWEVTGNSLKILDASNSIIFQKTFGSPMSLERTQQLVIRDVRALELYDKKEVKSIVLRIGTAESQIKQAERQPEEPAMQLLERDTNLEEIHASIEKIGIVERGLVEVQMATCISAALHLNVPIWLLVIGNPSSLKTEVLRLFRGVRQSFYLSTMSENAFASGYMPPDGSEPKDLLSIIDGKVLLIRDLTTLFSLNEETVKKILGDLTSIFDGVFEKFTATRGLKKYRAVFPIIGCITPAILSKHFNYVHQLGARFLTYRIPNLSNENSKRGYEIAWSKESRAQNIETAAVAVSSYCEQVMRDSKGKPVPTIDDEQVREWFNDAAEFVRRVRGIAITKSASFTKKEENGDEKEVSYYEPIDVQIEEPWRALNQLRNLAISLSVLRRKDTVTMEECMTLEPVIRSAAEVDRAEVLNALIETPAATTKGISEKTGKSYKTVGRRLKELSMLGLVVSEKDQDFDDEGVAARQWSIVPRFTNLLSPGYNSSPSPEFVSQPSTDTNSEGGDVPPIDDVTNVVRPEDLPF